MKLRAHDQIHVTAVKSESLRPGEVFDISDAGAADLMRAHPGLFEHVGEQKAAPAPEQKVEPVVETKVEPAIDNKSAIVAGARVGMAHRRGR